MYNTTARFFVVVVVVSSAKSFPGDYPKIIYHCFSPVVLFIDNIINIAKTLSVLRASRKCGSKKINRNRRTGVRIPSLKQHNVEFIYWEWLNLNADYWYGFLFTRFLIITTIFSWFVRFSLHPLRFLSPFLSLFTIKLPKWYFWFLNHLVKEHLLGLRLQYLGPGRSFSVSYRFTARKYREI